MSSQVSDRRDLKLAATLPTHTRAGAVTFFGDGLKLKHCSVFNFGARSENAKPLHSHRVWSGLGMFPWSGDVLRLMDSTHKGQVT